MAFPLTSLLTDFTGADETPLNEGGAFAVCPVSGVSNPMQRVSNESKGTANATNLSYHTGGTFADGEVWGTLGTNPGAGKSALFGIRLVEIGAGTTDGLLVAFSPSGSSVLIYLCTDGTPALQRSLTGITIPAGARLGLRTAGSRLWTFVNDVPVGGIVTAFQSAGAIAHGMNDNVGTLTDFGGGAAAALYGGALRRLLGNPAIASRGR